MPLSKYDKKFVIKAVVGNCSNFHYKEVCLYQPCYNKEQLRCCMICSHTKCNRYLNCKFFDNIVSVTEIRKQTQKTRLKK